MKGEDKTNDVVGFAFEGGKCEITFRNGKTFKYNAFNVQIIESITNEEQAGDCLAYLSELADQIGIKITNDNGEEFNILSHYYSKIGFVDEESMLGAFLTGRLANNEARELVEPIYPFGLNLSQKAAVDNALKNKLSIIEGPPGTGKTQTILNIIANIVMRGQSVAVVSSNNSATKNVLEKLQKNQVDFIAAYLGSNANKAEFIKSQCERPDLSQWVISPEVEAKTRASLKRMHEQLQLMLDKKVELSKKKQEFSAFETEKKHFKKSEQKQIFMRETEKLKRPGQALELWLQVEYFEKLSWVMQKIQMILDLFRGIKRRNAFIAELLNRYTQEDLIAHFQARYYELKEIELKVAINKLENELSNFDFDAKMQEYTQVSLEIFQASLAKRFEGREFQKFDIQDLKQNSQAFIEEYPVVLSTTYSLRGSLSNDTTYDYVIIDESSQVDICTGALALSCAKNAVIVGDLKQLSHVVDSKKAKETDAIFYKYNLPESYLYKNESLLSSLVKLFPQAPRTLLREHYRCHPKIIEFCNQKFYNGELIVMTESKSQREPLIIYKTVEGNHERARVNQRQIDVIRNEIIPEQHLNLSDGSLGIITPYRKQTNALQEAFEGLNVKADTVDKFQGQENEIVILSTVDNEISEFADNANRLNVAVSRAIDQLIVVVNDTDTLNDTNLGDLVKYVEYNNMSIIQSKTRSVFDYLFKSYSKKRKELLSKSKRVSEFPSENLAYGVISKVLSEIRSHNLDIAVHVPLRLVLADLSLLDPEESRFASYYKTHVDFLIFDRVTKEPKLVVEIDGASFHQEGSLQAGRDQLKDRILNKYELPIIRMRTDGSEEESRLLEMLSMS